MEGLRVNTSTASTAALLLMAARAVGEALGVTMRPAAPSENPATLREPLEAIARAMKS